MSCRNNEFNHKVTLKIKTLNIELKNTKSSDIDKNINLGEQDPINLNAFNKNSIIKMNSLNDLDKIEPKAIELKDIQGDISENQFTQECNSNSKINSNSNLNENKLKKNETENESVSEDD